MNEGPKFSYVAIEDAVGTLFETAAVRLRVASLTGNKEGAKKWFSVGEALRAAWPEYCHTRRN